MSLSINTWNLLDSSCRMPLVCVITHWYLVVVLYLAEMGQRVSQMGNEGYNCCLPRFLDRSWAMCYMVTRLFATHFVRFIRMEAKTLVKLLSWQSEGEWVWTLRKHNLWFSYVCQYLWGLQSSIQMQAHLHSS